MNKAFVTLIFFLAALFSFSQGKFAGPTIRKLIGKTFTDDRHIMELKGYEYREGTMITDIHDPAPLALTVLWKKNSAVIVFSGMDDTLSNIHYIVDVIEVRNILPGWDIKTVGCQYGETEGEIIVALVNPGKGEYVKAIKQAWSCNRDKLRFETISLKKLHCINEGDD
ncbi:MAG: hypothetical protein JST17_04085 [Bacteroidetes bacterium]|nr:hypothetical protein [Bacteroidota bacterium]MBS1929588.1 hypothetical protein [Bacteroidota bacterium]